MAFSKGASGASYGLSSIFNSLLPTCVDFAFEDTGEQRVKNIARPVRVYRVSDAIKSLAAPATPALILLRLLCSVSAARAASRD